MSCVVRRTTKSDRTASAKLPLIQHSEVSMPNGSLKEKCSGCGHMIYIKTDTDGVTRPYKSWVAGDVDEGVWALHDCPARHPRAAAEQEDKRIRSVTESDPALRAIEQVIKKCGLADDVAVRVVGTVIAAINER